MARQSRSGSALKWPWRSRFKREGPAFERDPRGDPSAYSERAVELLVPGAAEDVAAKCESPFAVGCEANLRDASWHHVRANLEVRQVKAMRNVERGYFENRRHPAAQ